MKNKLFVKLTALILALLSLTIIGVSALDEVLPDLIVEINETTEETSETVEETSQPAEETSQQTEETSEPVEEAIVSEAGTELVEELQPMAANSCGDDITKWQDMTHTLKSEILTDAWNENCWNKSYVGDNPDIGYNSNGMIVLIGVGSYSGHTQATTLERAWYI